MCPCLSQAAHSIQISSVAQSCPTLCDPMHCSTPGLPVHHQLSEFTQTHVHRVRDAIQPSHPLSSPSPAPMPPSIRVFSNESTLRMRWPKYWSFIAYSFNSNVLLTAFCFLTKLYPSMECSILPSFFLPTKIQPTQDPVLTPNTFVIIH